MARFSAAKYDPRQDSSRGTKALRSSGFEGVLLKVAEGECACGCGETLKHAGRKFRQGHDARLRGILTRAHLTRQPVTLVLGDEAQTTTALALAAEHGMRHHLEAAGARASDKFVQPASGVVVGPRVGEHQRIKVGRWEYDATISEVTDDQIIYEYRTQNGIRALTTART